MVKYNKEETLAFLHGYAYAKAEFMKQNDEKYKDTPINTIVSEIITNSIEEIKRVKDLKKFESKQIMPVINGKPFQCTCGCFIFSTQLDGTYKCNACPLEYSVE